MLRAPKKPSATAYSTSITMYGSSPIHMSSCLRGMPTHELSVNFSRVPSSFRTTIVMRSVAVIPRTLARALHAEQLARLGVGRPHDQAVEVRDVRADHI